jgi:hypothetical protein
MAPMSPLRTSTSARSHALEPRGRGERPPRFTSPRLPGEVGSHRRCDPGEGDSQRVEPADRAPHPASPSGFAGASPNPLRASFARLDPVKNGTRGRSADAEPTCTQSTRIISACNYRSNFQTATPKCLSRHCERSEAIHRAARKNGLLRRSAPRNDGKYRYRPAISRRDASEVCWKYPP